MPTHNKGESGKMTDLVLQNLVREVFPKDAPKRIARLMNVPIETARTWFYRHMSNARRREVVLALIDEYARQNRRREETLHELQRIAGEYDQMGIGVAGRRSAQVAVAESIDAAADKLDASTDQLNATTRWLAARLSK